MNAISTFAPEEPTRLLLIVDGTTYLHANSLTELSKQLVDRAASLVFLAEQAEPTTAPKKTSAGKANPSVGTLLAGAKKEITPKPAEQAAIEPEPTLEEIASDEGKAAASAEEQDTSASETAKADTDALTAATYEDVRGAVTKLAATKGRDAALAVLDTFGVDHASKLTEEQWPETVAALAEATEA